MNSGVMKNIREAEKRLKGAGVPAARLEAEVLLAHALGVERLRLYEYPERALEAAESRRYEDLIRQRCAGTPTAYLRGKKEFFSRDFKVGPGVLIPRAETELLVEEAVAIARVIAKPSLLELGTGSGAVIISLLLNLPESRAAAADLSSKALEYAVENAKAHRVDSRIRFVRGNLFEALSPGEKFDLIVSNPPYVPTCEIGEDLRFEPREALDGGADGLSCIRKILEGAPSFLESRGAVLLEIGDANQNLLKKELQNYGAAYAAPLFKKDLAGRNRVVVLPARQP